MFSNIFHCSGSYKVKAERPTSRYPEHDHTGSDDEDYFSFNEGDYCDNKSSLDNGTRMQQMEGLDHEKNAGFKYDDIDPTAEVRLLRITKATKSAIEGHFKKVRVTNLAKENYLALSYTWGKARTDQDLQCVNIGGQTLYIRNNLWDFFVSNEHQCRTKYLYIDAICINQRNMHERGHQVKLMADIYTHADLVYVWLGKPLGTQRDNLKALRWKLSNPNTREAWDRHAMFGLSYVCASRYWTRLWIIQELLLARDIVIISGKWRFGWDELAKLQRHPLATSDLDVHKKLDWWTVWMFTRPKSYQHEDDTELNMSNGWERGLRIFDHRRRWRRRVTARTGSTPQRPVGLPLYKAVSYFSNQECYHARDKIYAMVGLLEESERNEITPSYQATHDEVYSQALRIGLLLLQRDVEPKALAEGYYPRDKYEDYASALRKVLDLERKDVAQATMEAFQMDSFRRNFVSNCKDERGLAWRKDKSAADVESNIYYEFLMLTEGKESSLKVFRLRLNIQGKNHLTAAALAAARFGFYEEEKFLKANEKQGYTYRMLYGAAKVWQRAAHFRKWTPFKG